jgi:glycosyltransferase involved in cell wall biosynthesis
VSALTPFTAEIRTFPSAWRSRSLARKAKGRALSLVSGGRLDGPARRLGEAAAALAAVEPFDAVLFSGKRTSGALALLPDVPVVADMCDATSARIQRNLRVATPARRLVLALDYLDVRGMERQLASRASHLVFASARDRELVLRELARAGIVRPATVIPNGVDLDYWSRGEAGLGRDTVVLTGAMDYRPNEDAALELIQTIMPLVRRRVPEARLLVVGRDPTTRLRAAGAVPGVTVTGFVDDVRPYLVQAGVFAAPLRFGAGIQNKVLEAMAMEVPVVASSLAADGLRTDHGLVPPVTVADDPERFAAELAEKLLAARRSPEPDRAARRFVAEHFVWRTSGETLERVLETACGRATGATAPATA